MRCSSCVVVAGKDVFVHAKISVDEILVCESRRKLTAVIESFQPPWVMGASPKNLRQGVHVPPPVGQGVDTLTDGRLPLKFGVVPATRNSGDSPCDGVNISASANLPRVGRDDSGQRHEYLVEPIPNSLLMNLDGT